MASTPRPLPPSFTPLATHESAEYESNRIFVDIPPRRKYVPGNGPPLQAISLAPPSDSTAYIVDRILLPPNVYAPDGKPRPKRMTYLIGWSDLPAARLLVPALNILDYVSPRALEIYECDLEQELEEDIAKLEEEKKAQESQPLIAKKKKGRPPKHTQIEAAAVADLEAEDDKTGWLKGGAMAFSTPQKARAKEFAELSDDGGSPSRQLAQEEAQSLSRESSLDQGRDQHPRARNGGVDRGSDLLNGREPSIRDTSNSEARSESDSSRGPSYEAQRTFTTTTSAGSFRWGVFRTTTEESPEASAEGTGVGSATAVENKEEEVVPKPAAAVAELEPTTPPKQSGNSPNKSKKRKTPHSAEITPTSQPKSKKPAKSKPKAEQQPQVVDGEEVWVVKRIEDCEVYEVEGRGIVRYFKVLWEGDWPPDQNPSWEPEENLAPNLVRNFFKRGKARRRKTAEKSRLKAAVSAQKTASTQAKLKQTKLNWEKGQSYSSVGEAFAGGPGEDGGVEQGEHELLMDHADFDTQQKNDADGESAQGEDFFVVDQEPRPKASRMSWFGGGAGGQLFGSRIFS